jgi:hypothetical protein
MQSHSCGSAAIGSISVTGIYQQLRAVGHVRAILRRLTRSLMFRLLVAGTVFGPVPPRIKTRLEN